MEINWDTIEFEFIEDKLIKHEQEMDLLDIHDISPDSTLSAIDEMDIDVDFDDDFQEIIKESFYNPELNSIKIKKEKKEPKRKQKNGTKNFSCDVCEVKLPSLSYLKRHYTTKGHQRQLMKVGNSGEPIVKQIDERIEELTELSNDEKELLALFDEQISQMSNEDFFDVKEEIVKSFEGIEDFNFEIKKENVPMTYFDIDLTSNEISQNFDMNPKFQSEISPNYQQNYSSTSSSNSSLNTSSFLTPKTTKNLSIHCEPCNKFFTHKCHYTQHVKTVHSGVKPFKCQRCGKKFATENELTKHAAKHDGLKPFRCLQCPKSYNNKVDLKRHEKNHEFYAPHPCEICGRGFVRRDHLEKHYQSHERKGKKQLKSAYENGVNFL